MKILDSNWGKSFQEKFIPRVSRGVFNLILVVIISSSILIFINYFTLKTTSAVRAYISGESRYSKGQKDAARYLSAYLNTRHMVNWRDFQREISIPLGDSIARVNLMNDGDLKLVRMGFLHGNNHPDDLDDLIWLFKTFHNVSFMKKAIRIWTEGDSLIAKLNSIGQDANQKMKFGKLSIIERDNMLSSINELTEQLTVKEKEFSNTLGETARFLNSFLFFVNMFITLLILGSASAFAITMINHLKNSEVELQLKNKSLTETNRELDKFIYSASHDLRSPITSLKGLIEITKIEKEPERVKQYLDMMTDSLDKQDQFIRDIIYYSKNKRSQVVSEKIELEKIIDEVIDLNRFIPGADRITFKKEINQEIIYADSSRLKIILGNLISNAIKYSDEKKSRSHIIIRTSGGNEKATIEVEDNGIGIRKQDMPRVFEMFFVGQNNKKGTGVGLYITKESVEKMSGTIRVESEEAAITKFIINLPIYGGHQL